MTNVVLLEMNPYLRDDNPPAHLQNNYKSLQQKKEEQQVTLKSSKVTDVDFPLNDRKLFFFVSVSTVASPRRVKTIIGSYSALMDTFGKRAFQQRVKMLRRLNIMVIHRKALFSFLFFLLPFIVQRRKLHSERLKKRQL